MGVDLGVRGIEYHGNLTDKGVHEEAAVENCGICSRENNIRFVYMHRADGGVQ